MIGNFPEIYVVPISTPSCLTDFCCCCCYFIT